MKLKTNEVTPTTNRHKQRLLAICISAPILLAVPYVVSAKTTVYGMLQTEVNEYDYTTRNTSFATPASGTAVEDNARGLLGVKAEEKLGNGLTAIAKFEWRVDTTDGTLFSTGAYESLVGLKGSFGTVEFGSLASAYKITGGVKYDPFVATALEARGKGAMTHTDLAGANTGLSSPTDFRAIAASNNVFGHNSAIDKSLGFRSANYSGFSFDVTYSPHESILATGNDGDYSFAVRYNNGPIELFVAGVKDAAFGTSVAELESVKVGGQYKFANHTVSAQLEKTDARVDATKSTETDTWFLGWQMKLGANILVAQVGGQDMEGTGFASNSMEASYWAVGLIHEMSKSVRVYVGYRSSEWERGSATLEEQVFGAGLRVFF